MWTLVFNISTFWPTLSFLCVITATNIFIHSNSKNVFLSKLILLCLSYQCSVFDMNACLYVHIYIYIYSSSLNVQVLFFSSFFLSWEKSKYILSTSFILALVVNKKFPLIILEVYWSLLEWCIDLQSSTKSWNNNNNYWHNGLESRITLVYKYNQITFLLNKKKMEFQKVKIEFRSHANWSRILCHQWAETPLLAYLQK